MTQLTVTRKVNIPDPLRLERYRRMPELGPSVLFFSGGTALRKVSRELTHYTKNSIHLLTSFDSGGSSAKLRQVFDIPAVGDIRSRLLDLADFSITGNPEVYALANYRLPKNLGSAELLTLLDSMIAGQHKLIKAIPDPMRKLLRFQLGFFRDVMPETFDLSGASIGNLVLAGGYINCQRQLDPILYLFSKLLVVQGFVRPVICEPYHLAVRLEDGEIILGQHQFTGKEGRLIDSKIERMWLSSSAEENIPAVASIGEKVAQTIREADLICYPPGSFYSSLIANLLPQGVGNAIAKNTGPKVFVPNLGYDPEQFGMTGDDLINTLLSYLSADETGKEGIENFLTYVMMDSQRGAYPAGMKDSLQKWGVQLIDVPLISDESAPYYDSQLLAQALLALT